jgi:tetratricopeptide (TPR) repeat protein
MNRTFATTVVAAGLSMAVSIGSAVAFSDGGTEAPVVCKKGYVYSEKAMKCVKVDAGLLDDKALFQQGRALAKAGQYDEALAVLAAVKDQKDSMVLTMIGYSKRKLGNWNEGMAYYRQALAIDPNNVNTHEYVGEAWLSKGRFDLAKAELTKIAAISGTDSEQYRDLAKAINGQPEL